MPPERRVAFLLLRGSLVLLEGLALVLSQGFELAPVAEGDSLTAQLMYGVIYHMKAQEIFKVKQVFGSGIVEILIWQVPEPVAPSERPYKYRLVYGVETRAGFLQ
jgi:hypothetical protein